MKRFNLFCLLVLVVMVGLIGDACSPVPVAEESGLITVRVVATEDFGETLILDKTLEVPSETSAMTALEQAAEVETEYGGGFVSAINGFRSGYNRGMMRDWFVYLNGILANTGVMDYTLHAGDVQHWDIHDWGFRQFVPAIIGGFPEPLLHGYGGKNRETIVVFPGSLKNEADKIRQVLLESGISSVSQRQLDALSQKDKETGNLILLGTMDMPLIVELNHQWKKLGYFTNYRDGNLVAINLEGKEVAGYGAGSGIIQATQNPWNPKGIGACENVAWMIAGIDITGVRNAVDIMINKRVDLQYACAVIADKGKVVRIP